MHHCVYPLYHQNIILKTPTLQVRSILYKGWFLAKAHFKIWTPGSKELAKRDSLRSIGTYSMITINGKEMISIPN